MTEQQHAQRDQMHQDEVFPDLLILFVLLLMMTVVMWASVEVLRWWWPPRTWCKLAPGHHLWDYPDGSQRCECGKLWRRRS